MLLLGPDFTEGTAGERKADGNLQTGESESVAMRDWPKMHHLSPTKESPSPVLIVSVLPHAHPQNRAVLPTFSK